MYNTLMFEVREIEEVVQEKFDKNFGFYQIREYSNDCAIPYWLGSREDEKDAYDEYSRDCIQYNNEVRSIIDMYMISKGAKFNDKVWIDVTW